MENMRYTVADVARKRGVTERAIYKQMKTHEKELEGHIEKVKGKQWLDEYAVQLLDEASSGSAPVIVEDTAKEEMLNEIEELKRKILKLELERDMNAETANTLSKNMAKMMENHEADAKLIQESKLYLEQRDNAVNEVNNLRSEKEQLEKELGSFKKTIFGFYKKLD